MVVTKNSARHQWFFRTKIVLLFLFVVCVSVQVKAQTFQSTSPYSMTQQGRQAVDVNSAGSYHTYESTIYEPFTAASPSSNSNSSSAPSGIRNRRNGFGTPETENPGVQPDQCPLGDAWSLLIFAAIGAGVIFIKQRKKLKANA